MSDSLNCMRPILRSLLPLFALFALATIGPGCGEDKATGIVDAVPGDPDSEEYSSVSSVLGGEAFALTGAHWHSLLEGEIPGAVRTRSGTATPAHDTVLSVTVTVDSATGWIVIEALAANHGDTVEILDSVRFHYNGVPTIPSDTLPPDMMSSVDVIISGHLHANDSTEFVGTLKHASRINLEVLERDPGLGTITYELNLVADDTLQGTGWDTTWGVCDIHVAAHRAVDHLVEVKETTPHPSVRGSVDASIWRALAAHEGCPHSGTVLLEMDVHLHCTGGEAEVTVDSEWKIEAEFQGGDQVRLIFTSDGFYWMKTVDCSELTEL